MLPDFDQTWTQDTKIIQDLYHLLNPFVAMHNDALIRQ